MRYIVLVALFVCVGVPVIFVFYLGGGIKALLPPLRYGLDVTLEVAVDDQVQMMQQGVLCSVKDQRGSIAVGDFHTKTEGDPLFLQLDGGRTILITDFHPCRWQESPPAPGVTYRMAASEQRATARQSGLNQDAVIEFRGVLSIISDVAEPRVIGSTVIALGQSALGVSILGGAVTRNDHPTAYPLPFTSRVMEVVVRYNAKHQIDVAG